jgi:anti-sigma factor RsiW
MVDCENRVRLDAYHDGELPPAGRSQVEAHLRDCPSCAAELAAMRRMSVAFADAAPREPSHERLLQLAASVRAEPSDAETSDAHTSDAPVLLRLFRRTAVAAGVLLACALAGGVYQSQRVKAAAHEAMVLDHVATRSRPVAFATDPVSDERQFEQRVLLAQWIADDLRGRPEER